MPKFIISKCSVQYGSIVSFNHTPIVAAKSAVDDSVYLSEGLEFLASMVNVVVVTDPFVTSKTISFKAMIIGDESQTFHELKLRAAARAKVSEMLDLVRGLHRIV